MNPQDEALKPCPMCGSGPARQPGRYTNASFSGVEVMDAFNQPYVWCGTCCLRTRECDSVAEAITAWNTRLSHSTPGDAEVREALERIAGKNDLSGVPDDEVEAAARNALYECELIARDALEAATPSGRAQGEVEGGTFHIVWNEMRNEGFITDDEQDAIACYRRVKRAISSTVGNAFAEAYEDDELSLETVTLPAAPPAAYIQGATDVHTEWLRAHDAGEAPPRGDPEFGEAAGDYADAALDPFDSSVQFSQPSPASSTAGEALGEALFKLSARLKDSGFLNDDANHKAYEAVVAAFQALSPLSGEPAFSQSPPGNVSKAGDAPENVQPLRP